MDNYRMTPFSQSLHSNRTPFPGGTIVKVDGLEVTNVLEVDIPEADTLRHDHISGDGRVLVLRDADVEMRELRGYIELTPASASVPEHPCEKEIRNGINKAAIICHQRAQDAGWWDKYDGAPDHLKPDLLAARQMLIVSEVAEAMEGLRKGRNDDHLTHRKAEEVELADAIIRIFDYAGKRGFNLGDAMIEKMAYNLARADHKPENRAKVGGKCF